MKVEVCFSVVRTVIESVTVWISVGMVLVRVLRTVVTRREVVVVLKKWLLYVKVLKTVVVCVVSHWVTMVCSVLTMNMSRVVVDMSVYAHNGGNERKQSVSVGLKEYPAVPLPVCRTAAVHAYEMKDVLMVAVLVVVGWTHAAVASTPPFAPFSTQLPITVVANGSNTDASPPIAVK